MLHGYSDSSTVAYHPPRRVQIPHQRLAPAAPRPRPAQADLQRSQRFRRLGSVSGWIAIATAATWVALTVRYGLQAPANLAFAVIAITAANIRIATYVTAVAAEDVAQRMQEPLGDYVDELHRHLQQVTVESVAAVQQLSPLRVEMAALAGDVAQCRADVHQLTHRASERGARLAESLHHIDRRLEKVEDIRERVEDVEDVVGDLVTAAEILADASGKVRPLRPRRR